MPKTAGVQLGANGAAATASLRMSNKYSSSDLQWSRMCNCALERREIALTKKRKGTECESNLTSEASFHNSKAQQKHPASLSLQRVSLSPPLPHSLRLLRQAAAPGRPAIDHLRNHVWEQPTEESDCPWKRNPEELNIQRVQHANASIVASGGDCGLRLSGARGKEQHSISRGTICE